MPNGETAELVEKVIQKIKESMTLRETLRVDRISWSTPYDVKIDDMLNEAVPCIYEETQLGGVRKLTKTEYINHLNIWRKKTVGGRVTCLSSGGVNWTPHEHSRLYKLTRHAQVESSTKQLYEYYLLQHGARNIFLKKKFGKKNALKTLTPERQDSSFLETLESFLLESEV